MRRGREPAHQPHRKRRRDHGAAAEAHDRHAGRHAGPVGKPFDQRRHRRHVAEPEADAAEHAIAEIDDPQLVRRDTPNAPIRKPPPKQSAAANIARRGPPSSTQRPKPRPRAEEENGDGEIQPSSVSFQSSGADWRPRSAWHRQVEDAERVDLADAEMNAERRRGTIQRLNPGFSDRMATVKYRENPIWRRPYFGHVRSPNTRRLAMLVVISG